MARKTLAAAAAALIVFAASASAETPKREGSGERGPASPEKRGGYRLDEVQILGSPEHPEILFFLPRAKFRLLPLGADREWNKSILLDDKSTREVPE